MPSTCLLGSDQFFQFVLKSSLDPNVVCNCRQNVEIKIEPLSDRILATLCFTDLFCPTLLLTLLVIGDFSEPSRCLLRTSLIGFLKLVNNEGSNTCQSPLVLSRDHPLLSNQIIILIVEHTYDSRKCKYIYLICRLFRSSF